MLVCSQPVCAIVVRVPRDYIERFSSFMQVLLILYPFLWWQLFSMLLRQRKKRLGGASPGALKKRQ